MAMTKCKECGNTISTKAVSCPKCGIKIIRTSGCTQVIAVFFAIMLGLVIVSAIVGNISKSEKQEKDTAIEQARVALLTQDELAEEAAQRKLEAEEKKADGLKVSAGGACMTFIKKFLHDPSSADFAHSSESIISNEGNTWKVIRPVRSKNAFGAFVRENYLCTMILTDDSKWMLIDLKPM